MQKVLTCRSLAFLAGGVACLLITVVPQYLVLAMAVAGKFGAAGSFDLAFLYTTEIFPTVSFAVVR